jgi:hypothetical protein
LAPSEFQAVFCDGAERSGHFIVRKLYPDPVAGMKLLQAFPAFPGISGTRRSANAERNTDKSDRP